MNTFSLLKSIPNTKNAKEILPVFRLVIVIVRFPGRQIGLI